MVIISTLSKPKKFWISAYVGKALYYVSFSEVAQLKVPSLSYSTLAIFLLTDCAGSLDRF